MLLTEVVAEGLRCFGPANPLRLELPGINVLVGENDSGKTAVVDAIRLALGARSEDFVRLTEDDFHVSAQGRADQLVVRCTLDDLAESEQWRFLEWCVIEDGRQRLHVHVTGRTQSTRGGGRRVFCERRAGRDGDGPSIDGALREYLRVAYLRPLRDAERQLRPGRRSRLSQILGALPQLDKQSQPARDDEPPTLASVLEAAHDGIRENPAISEVETRINDDYLRRILFEDEQLAARLGIGANMRSCRCSSVWSWCSTRPVVQASTVPRGLGINNILFMAAELLLLPSADDQMPTLVIEEPEAHLHPQLQVRFMRMLEDRLATAPGARRVSSVSVTATRRSTTTKRKRPYGSRSTTRSTSARAIASAGTSLPSRAR